MEARAEIIIKGVVQVAGFRPFIHRLAVAHNLAGWILNSSGGGDYRSGRNKEGYIERFYSRILS